MMNPRAKLKAAAYRRPFLEVQPTQRIDDGNEWVLADE